MFTDQLRAEVARLGLWSIEVDVGDTEDEVYSLVADRLLADDARNHPAVGDACALQSAVAARHVPYLRWSEADLGAGVACGSRPVFPVPSREHGAVWYPFKFRGKLSYTTVGGLLGGELSYASRPTWKRRRRWRLARRNDSDFLVAAVDRNHRSVVEAWSDTPDHRFVSVVLRSEIGNDVSVWTETRIQPGGFRLFRLEPGQTSTELQCRSGRMIGWSTLVDGHVVNVLHPERLPTIEIDLALVPLHSIPER